MKPFPSIFVFTHCFLKHLASNGGYCYLRASISSESGIYPELEEKLRMEFVTLEFCSQARPAVSISSFKLQLLLQIRNNFV